MDCWDRNLPKENTKMKTLLWLPLLLIASNADAANFTSLDCKAKNAYADLRIKLDPSKARGPTGSLLDNYNSANMACGLWALDRLGRGATATCVGIWRSSYAADGGDVAVTVKIRKQGDGILAEYLRNWDERDDDRPDLVRMDCELK